MAGEDERPGTQEMKADEAGPSADDAGAKPKVSPTVIDADDGATKKDEAPPWAAAGKTQPGEPPLMDIAPAQPHFAPPPQPQNVPIVAPPPVAPMVPRYPPAMAPPPRRGGSNMGLVIGLLLGVATVIGVIALIVVFRPEQDEAPPQQLGGPMAAPMEVKPEVPTEETVAEAPVPVPAPEPEPAPKPAYTASKPKPKPTATAQPTAQPTSQPTATETQPLPPPPPPNTGGGQTGGGKKPRLKIPK